MARPQSPEAIADWTLAVAAWPGLGNDADGDCVEAAALHQVQLWTAYAGLEEAPDTISAVADYVDATGFVPATATAPALNDNGTNIAAFLERWKTEGIKVEEGRPLHKLDDYALIDPSNQEHLELAIQIFGGALVGVALPLSAQAEIAASQPWVATTDAPGGWGGHCELLPKYDATGPTGVTWGALQVQSWPWWRAYGTEAYVLLSRSWLKPNGVSPSGYTFDQLTTIFNTLRAPLGATA
jgi:hypothetical protein